eukprot:5031581-Prymnesium_polylepis.1
MASRRMTVIGRISSFGMSLSTKSLGIGHEETKAREEDEQKGEALERRYHKFVAEWRMRQILLGLSLMAVLLFIFGTIDVYKVLHRRTTDQLPYVVGQMAGSALCVCVLLLASRLFFVRVSPFLVLVY